MNRTAITALLGAMAAAPACAQFVLVDDYRDVSGDITFFLPGQDEFDSVYYVADPGTLFSHDETIAVNHPDGWATGHVVHTSNITASAMTFSSEMWMQAQVSTTTDGRLLGYVGTAATVTFMVDEPTTIRFQGATDDAYVTLYDYAKDYLVLEFYFDQFDTTYDLVPDVLYEIGFGGTVGVDDNGTGDLLDEHNSTSLTITVDGAPEPCAADLAEPFGVLNFFDVSAFLTAYSNQQPAADFAEPPGVYNFFDVSAFLGAYNAGCP